LVISRHSAHISHVTHRELSHKAHIIHSTHSRHHTLHHVRVHSTHHTSHHVRVHSTHHSWLATHAVLRIWLALSKLCHWIVRGWLVLGLIWRITCTTWWLIWLALLPKGIRRHARCLLSWVLWGRLLWARSLSLSLCCLLLFHHLLHLLLLLHLLHCLHLEHWILTCHHCFHLIHVGLHLWGYCVDST
jgi:hypothetical protein